MSIVDERSRIMLHNLAVNSSLYGTDRDPQIYAHVAPEFAIYENYRIKTEPHPGGIVWVEMWLPSTGWYERVFYALGHPDCYNCCNGKSSETSESDCE